MARIEIGELEAFLKWLETVEYVQAGTGFLTEDAALHIPDGVAGYVDGSDHLTLEEGAVGNTIFVQRESGATPTQIASVEGLYGGAIYTLVNNDPDNTTFLVVAGADIESRVGDVELVPNESILIRAITPTSFEVLPGPIPNYGTWEVVFTDGDGIPQTTSDLTFFDSFLGVGGNAGFDGTVSLRERLTIIPNQSSGTFSFFRLNADSTEAYFRGIFDGGGDLDGVRIGGQINDNGGTSHYYLEIVDTLGTDPPFRFNGDVYSSGGLWINGSVVKLTSLPTTDPGVSGQLWNDSGTLKISP